MKIKFTLFFVSLIIVFHCSSQTLVPYLKNNGNYIYVDSATMKPVIKKEFHTADLFQDSVAWVTNYSMDGSRTDMPFIINKQGIEIFKNVRTKEGWFYEFGRKSNDGLRVVSFKNNWGYIDNKGKIQIGLKYSQASGFFNGLALVQKGNILARTAKSGLIDKNGIEIVPIIYDYISPCSFEGLYTVALNNKVGLINRFGEVKIPLKYDWVDLVVSEGTIRVAINDKIGIIDTMDNQIVPIKYSLFELSPFSSGYAKITDATNNKIQFIDKKGEIKSDIPADIEGVFSKKGIAKFKSDGKFGLIDISGKILVKPIYDYIGDFSNDGYCDVQLKNKHGLINEEGKIILPVKYDFISSESDIIIDQGVTFKNKGFFRVGYFKGEMEQSFYIDLALREYREIIKK